MGITITKKSRVSSKVLMLMVSLVLTGFVMRFLGPQGKLDGRLFYTGAEANDFLNGLSLVDRGFYLYGELVDLWFLTNYSWLLFLGFRYFLSSGSRLIFLALVPGLLDLLETTAILVFLIKGQAKISLAVLSLISLFKWIMALGALSFLGISFINKLRLTERHDSNKSK